MRAVPSLAVILALVVGCSQQAPAPNRPAATKAGPAAAGHDHDHADHDHDHDHGEMGDDKDAAKDDAHEHAAPASLAEGIAAFETLLASVKEHVAADAKDSADGAVHEVGHLLESFQGLVANSTLAEEGKQAAGKAIDELFACFDSLDQALHAEEGQGDTPKAALEKVAERIEKAFQAIKEAK